MSSLARSRRGVRWQSLLVHRHYHLKGWDAAPTGEFVRFRFASRGGRWAVVGDDDEGGYGDSGVLPEETVPEPWAFGDVSATFDAWVSPVDGMSADGTLQEVPPAGTRMVVTPGMLRFPEEAARIVIRHELTHVATLMQDEQAPSWLGEGVAEYTAHRVGEYARALRRIFQ